MLHLAVAPFVIANVHGDRWHALEDKKQELARIKSDLRMADRRWLELGDRLQELTREEAALRERAR